MVETRGSVLEDLEKLTTLTYTKRQRLWAIHNITKMQGQAVDQQDIKVLTGYIKEKQRHIDAIDELDTQFAKLYNVEMRQCIEDADKENQETREHLLINQLRIEISRVKEITQDIWKLEKMVNNKGQDMLENIKQKIRHIQQGQKGHNAYNRAYSYNDGIYIDRKK